MQNLHHEGLDIRVDLGTSGRIGLAWNGRATSKEPAKILGPFFDDALNLAQQTSSWIEMHFEDLEHFNSSTIAAVIQFINAAHSRHVDVVIHYDQARKSQQLSFEALRRALRPFESVSGSTVKFLPVPR